MSTATLTAPTPAPPASPPEPSEWARVTLENFGTVANAEKVLAAEPPELSIEDCLQIRQRIGWKPTLADQLRFSQLPLLAREITAGVLGEIQSYVASCAGDNKRESVGWALTDFLAGIDEEIVRRLDAGEEGELLRPEDFGGGRLHDGIVIVTEKGVSDTGGYLAGLINRLPQDHSARALTADPYATDDGGPALILGPYVPNTPMRRFFCHDRILSWTSLFVKAQVQRQAARPLYQLTPEQIERAKERERLCQKLPPKAPVPPPTKPAVRGWVPTVLSTLETLPKVARLFKKPTPDVPLSDLLAVRAVLIRSDGPEGEDEPPFGQARPLGIHVAANRWAARHCGIARRQVLLEHVATLVGKIDTRIDNFVSEGSLWAARRHESLEAELAELRTELAELRAEVKGRRKP